MNEPWLNLFSELNISGLTNINIFQIIILIQTWIFCVICSILPHVKVFISSVEEKLQTIQSFPHESMSICFLYFFLQNCQTGKIQFWCFMKL